MKKGIAVLLLIVLLTACKAVPRTPVEKELFAMDTYMKMTAYGKGAKEALDKAASEIRRLDSLWSVGQENSEVSRINAARTGTVSPETAELLEMALTLHQETEGALDITIYPVMELWGFTGENRKVPSEEELKKTLALVDAGQIRFDGETITLGVGQGIDFGAIAKGYTSSYIMKVLKEQGVTGAILSLGGNVQCMGTKPDGSKWHIGIQRPDGGDGYLGVLTLTDKAVITSGGYERYFEENGTIYHHIIDPETGYPADSGLTSVTIVSADGALADALSTACFILGKEKAEAYWKAHADQFDMILYTEEGELLITEGLADIFESDLPVVVVKEDKNG